MARKVAIVAFEGSAALDVVGPFEVLAAAREVQVRRRAADLGYTPLLVGPSGRPIRSESGLRIVPEMTLSQLVASPRLKLHTLIVAGGSGARAAAQDPQVARAVRKVAGRAKRVSSVCTGAFVLGAAGLLDGKRATTHWAHCEALATMCPSAVIERDPIYVRDGTLWTSAGVTAGIDLSLAMVEADLGRDVASLVARLLVVFIRRAGGQSQFSAQLSAQAAESDALAELMSFIVEHPGADLQVPELARRAHLSVRHFSRLFRAQTGVSPAQYVEQVRVETARRLLETSKRSVEEVALGAGFGTPEALRRAFARRVRLSPREYRARFGAP